MAAVDYFLKIDEVEGESKDSKHKGEIDIDSFAWGAKNAGTSSAGGGAGAGKVVIDDINFSAKASKASPTLFLKCATGAHLPKAVLTVRKAGTDQQEYMKITLTDVLVSSYHSGGSAGSSTVPTDQFTLNFTKIEIEYKEQDSKGQLTGSVKKHFDVKANKGG